MGRSKGSSPRTMKTAMMTSKIFLSGTRSSRIKTNKARPITKKNCRVTMSYKKIEAKSRTAWMNMTVTMASLATTLPIPSLQTV